MLAADVVGYSRLMERVGIACAGHLDDTQAAAELIRDLKAIRADVMCAQVEVTSPFVRAEDRARLAEGLARAGMA
jgi:adenylate cyclase